MLKIHTSNKLEQLFGQFDSLSAAPLADPLAAEIVLVQSQGMARWLALQTANQQGISANFDYSFPAAFVWRLFKSVDGWRSQDPYAQDALVWAIYAILDDHIQRPEFDELAKYLARDRHILKPYQLAVRIARLFDQYMLFRPDWIEEWSKGHGDHWQAKLWRLLQENLGDNHRVKFLAEFLGTTGDRLNDRAGLPERISLFGISALPPSLFAVFAKLAEVLDVHLFLLNGCMVYWDDLVSEVEMTRINLKSFSNLSATSDLHYQTGNELLLNFAKMGREFQQILHCCHYEENNLFVETVPANVLEAVQADILAAVKPTVRPGNYYPESDQSIQVHAVHSPMREVEVLYQNLLAMFNDDKNLLPSDVLVMVPDISIYAPLISAVFSSPENENLRIPFSIADRGVQAGQEMIVDCLDLLEIAGGRMDASKVFDFLSRRQVMQSFEIVEAELETIRNFIEKSAIFWGIDRKHRLRLGVNDDKFGTWRAGLDRLLLGFAMPVEDELFGDTLPCDLAEGESAKLLGKFLNFFRTLEEFSEDIARQRSLPAWTVFFNKLLDDFFTDKRFPDRHYRQKQKILKALEKVVNGGAAAQYDQTVPFEVIRQVLIDELSMAGGHSEFLTGNLTFCQMVPMRSIPFKIICLLGMADGSFPRIDRPCAFDLMAREFRVGDRCRRDDDRYLFLETIISARSVLYISYVGLAANSELPPSIVVAELLKYVAAYKGIAQKDGPKALTTFHPLQPFSRRYFSGIENLISFSEIDHEIAQEISNARPCPGAFNEPLEAWSEPTVELSEFIAFFEHPVRYLFRNRLGVYLADRHFEVADRELFSLDGLGRYKLSNSLTGYLLDSDKVDRQKLGLIMQQSGSLPTGDFGYFSYKEALDEVEVFVGNLKNELGGERLPSLPVDIELKGLRLTGSLHELWPNGQFLIRPGNLKNLNYRDVVRFWLYHLIFNASVSQNHGRTTFMVLDGKKEYGPMPSALEELNKLALLFTTGMRRPLPLFPKTSFTFAQKSWRSKQPVEMIRAAEAQAAAKEVWSEGGFNTDPEKEDPYLWAAFGDSSPFVSQIDGGLDYAGIAEIVLKNALELMV